MKKKTRTRQIPENVLCGIPKSVKNTMLAENQKPWEVDVQTIHKHLDNLLEEIRTFKTDKDGTINMAHLHIIELIGRVNDLRYLMELL